MTLTATQTAQLAALVATGKQQRLIRFALGLPATAEVAKAITAARRAFLETQRAPLTFANAPVQNRFPKRPHSGDFPEETVGQLVKRIVQSAGVERVRIRRPSASESHQGSHKCR